MALELDHVFVCCAPGAPEADALVRRGFREGSGNAHPGQGTQNRRFFFANAYLELLWISNSAEARNQPARRTRLWERCTQKQAGVCPFGIVFRPNSVRGEPAPFPTWLYRPGYLPADFAIELAKGTSLEEPELIYLPFAHRSRSMISEPVGHVVPVADISSVAIGLPAASKLCAASQLAQSHGLVAYRVADDYLLELGFTATQTARIDLRPTLPLIFRCGPQQD